MSYEEIYFKEISEFTLKVILLFFKKKERIKFDILW